jgi:hypothetical protein
MRKNLLIYHLKLDWQKSCSLPLSLPLLSSQGPRIRANPFPFFTDQFGPLCTFQSVEVFEGFHLHPES